MGYIYTSPSSVKPDKTYRMNGVSVKEYFIPNHNVNKLTLPAKTKNKKIIGITIHNTEDLVNVEDDGRNYVAATLNNNMGGVYVHWYVDDLYAWHVFPNEYSSWSCSDSATGPGNSQTICIECIMRNSTDKESLKARDNAARLTAQLLYDNKLTVNDVYTHTYWINKSVGNTNGSKEQLCCISPAGRKTCPVFIIPKWTEFLNLVKKYLDAIKAANKKIYRVRKTWADAAGQIGAYRNLDSAKALAEMNLNYKVFNPDGTVCYEPKYYFRKAVVKVDTKAKTTYTSQKDLTTIPAKTNLIIYCNIRKKDANGVYWVRLYDKEHKFSKYTALYVKQSDLTFVK